MSPFRSMPRGSALITGLTLVALGACGRIHQQGPLAYDQNGERPMRKGRCDDTELIVVSNRSSHVAKVGAYKSGSGGGTANVDHEVLATILPGAVDTLTHVRKGLDIISYSYEDQEFISGMRVPIRGLSISCVKASD